MNTLSFKKTLLACILATAAVCANAQATDGNSADELVNADFTALRQIDEDRAGELWGSTSAFVKTNEPGDTFIDANVNYSTQLTSGATVFEKVSFRLEPNGWRLTGYQPRQNQ